MTRVISTTLIAPESAWLHFPHDSSDNSKRTSAVNSDRPVLIGINHLMQTGAIAVFQTIHQPESHSFGMSTSQTLRKSVYSWIRRYIIDDDPCDLEAINAALLQTQQALNSEAIPKELL